MDDEFPDPDEEYEMRYADEFELMNEFEFDEDKAPILPKGQADFKVKKSLKFDDASSTGSRSNSRLSDRTSTPDEFARKRQQHEMFGSLSDDEELSGKCGTHPAKKSRNEESLQRSVSPCQAFDYINNLLANRGTQPKRYVYRLIPTEPHQHVTTHSGQKLYIKMKSEEALKQKGVELSLKGPGKLLKVSIQTLKQQVENELRSKATTVAQELFEKRLQELEADDPKTVATVKEEKVLENSNDLWMEKYRPKTYLDLLSEETVNRTLLHWLKLWDKVVFNREVKIRAPKTEERAKPTWAATAPKNRFESKNGEGAKFANKFKKNTEGELKEEFDSIGRPLQKIVLICGPPGLGKTTLAHIVAKHAGYNPVEMNASDDRNVEAFKLQLEAATQMRSVLSSSPKPNCLIIDEVDGAPAPSITYLVNTVAATKDDKEKPAGNKKKKKTIGTICRPIICICNELYTPSLRPLRQAALVLHFAPTNPSKLAQRLMGISKEHSIQVDMSSLLALCEKADYDIRSCLATLYFLKTLKRTLRYGDVMNLNIGLKDNRKSLFPVWQEIFQIPRPKRRTYIHARERDGPLPLAPDVDVPLDSNAGEAAPMSARFVNILHAVQSCGEYDRMLQGVFENYPTIKFKDSYMNAVCSGLEWMCFYDIVNNDIQHTQNYTMYGYLPYSFVAIHFHLAAVLSQKIKFPTTHTEVNTKTTQNVGIITSMIQDLKAHVRVTNNRSTIILDIIPFILPIITPNLRPVSAQLYSAPEKEMIQRVIDIMISYNLTFRQEKTVDGAYRFCLEPDIEQVATFGAAPGVPNQRKTLTYSVKQMLAREIELEKMRQYESNWGPAIASKVVDQPDKPVSSLTETMKPPAERSLTLKPKPVAITNSRQATDFFGRPLKTPPKKKNADGSVETTQNDIWYHFKEGYTNAVRRSVKMSDFI